MTQIAVNTALVALRATYETCVHFDGAEDDGLMLVIPKPMWLEMHKPTTLRVVLTEED